MDNNFKNVFIFTLSVVVFFIIGLLFWYQDLQYSIPTKVPHNHIKKVNGDEVSLFIASETKPLLLHFFNPLCPCSKFNIDHLRSLIKNYSEKVDFYAILQSPDSITAVEKFMSYGLDIPYKCDLDGQIADKCGVYATPQATIIRNNLIYFNGNYNSSRYCTNPQTAYVRIALDSLVNHKTAPTFEQATISYGCSLPSDLIE